MLPITHPVALADQLQAARRDTDRAFHRDTTTLGMAVNLTDPAAWFTDRVARLLDDVAERRAARCEHLTHGPRPAYAALWRADRVVCRDCLSQLSHPEHAPGCDRCGADPEFITVHQVQIETLIVVYALCDPCDALEPTESDPQPES